MWLFALTISSEALTFCLSRCVFVVAWLSLGMLSVCEPNRTGFYIVYIYDIYITSISIAVMAFPDLLTNYVYVDEQNEGLWSVEIA